MADKSFDAIIIGGGNKGLITGMYLAKYGGMDVGIFEQRHELGGGWSSEESAAPGFITNTHAVNINKYWKIVLERDFPDFVEKGGKWFPFNPAMGTIFKEDHSCIVWHHADLDPDQEKTAASIARYSQKDADTWLELWKTWQEKIEPAFCKWIYNPPPPHHEPDILEQALMSDPSMGIDPIWAVKSALEVLRDLFESEEVIASVLRPSHAGMPYPPDLPGTGISQILLLPLLINFGGVVGGTHSFAHACHKIYLENGGKSLTKHEVENVIIENGVARGVRLTNGDEIEARKLVVSTLSPEQLCFQLIGEDYFQARTIRRIKNLSRRLVCITWYHWAVNERPKYKAEEYDPDVYKTGLLCLGSKDPLELVRENAWRTLGKMPPDPSPLVWCLSLSDPTQAPKGKHICGSEQFVLPANQLTEREWLEFKKKNAEDVIRCWQEYAPNMNWDNVIDYDPLTPYDCCRLKNMAPTGNWAVIDVIPGQTGKFRPVPELARYTTPVKNLYCTGSAWGFTGAATDAQAYNCYKVISKDFDLKKPWEEEGRPF
jgi:phytoene dehydrogenase-like protein